MASRTYYHPLALSRLTLTVNIPQNFDDKRLYTTLSFVPSSLILCHEISFLLVIQPYTPATPQYQSPRPARQARPSAQQHKGQK